MRVLIVDDAHNVLLDSYDELEPGAAIPELDEERGVITDLRTREPVGYVYVEVDPEFFADETASFLTGTLTTTALGGLLTAILILLPAIWMARRLTAPIIALTDVTRTIAQYGEAQLLPVTSQDELGQMSAAFNQMTRALEAQHDLRKRLVDDVSHELGTPLSVIHLEAASMRDGMQTPAEAADQIIAEVASRGTQRNQQTGAAANT